MLYVFIMDCRNFTTHFTVVALYTFYRLVELRMFIFLHVSPFYMDENKS